MSNQERDNAPDPRKENLEQAKRDMGKDKVDQPLGGERSYDKNLGQGKSSRGTDDQSQSSSGVSHNVTNQDKSITNKDGDDIAADENLSSNNDPEIDTPVHDPEKTEKKIPKID